MLKQQPVQAVRTSLLAFEASGRNAVHARELGVPIAFGT
jgi:hypothetical protein